MSIFITDLNICISTCMQKCCILNGCGNILINRNNGKILKQQQQQHTKWYKGHHVTTFFVFFLVNMHLIYLYFLGQEYCKP